ncbi:MAG TPA: hypothetical protein PK698_01850 [Bacilli bacterium]|jgi:hypothetical protein|nr:hypothetical protein [Bacilli bacterium]
MKNGKYINLGYYGNFKIGYGTVDHKNLKSIYIKLNSWITPNDDEINLDSLLLKTQRKIKLHIYHLKSEYFKKESIVDIDLRTNGVKMGKKSFLSIEITLFTEKHFDIKSKQIKFFLINLIKEIINNDLEIKNLFNFYKNKK